VEETVEETMQVFDPENQRGRGKSKEIKKDADRFQLSELPELT
jgi:hypothetical protein